MRKKKKENIILFLIGAIGYSLLEIVWRGYTHWSMTITGGICFRIINKISKLFKNKSIFKQALASATLITSVEYIVGLIVNILLKLDVWDYHKQKLNILGQICPLYVFLWFLLSFPLLKIQKTINKSLKSI